jgi:hypothetical protein
MDNGFWLKAVVICALIQQILLSSGVRGGWVFGAVAVSMSWMSWVKNPTYWPLLLVAIVITVAFGFGLRRYVFAPRGAHIAPDLKAVTPYQKNVQFALLYFFLSTVGYNYFGSSATHFAIYLAVVTAALLVFIFYINRMRSHLT